MKFSPLRKLAIRLACSHAEDREWVLRQLDLDERRQIESLLEEINLLGLAADASVVEALMSEESRPQAEPSRPEHAELLVLIARAEHAFWGGLCLQLLPAGERKGAIDALPNGARLQSWEASFSRRPVPPALVASLGQYLQGTEVADGGKA
ncbi:hypothetical protein LJR232_004492 [Aquipseudomonas alcaligenes]